VIFLWSRSIFKRRCWKWTLT